MKMPKVKLLHLLAESPAGKFSMDASFEQHPLC
jgi:hypothetical protein